MSNISWLLQKDPYPPVEEKGIASNKIIEIDENTYKSISEKFNFSIKEKGTDGCLLHVFVENASEATKTLTKDRIEKFLKQEVEKENLFLS